jgi:hypothetical protein
MLARPRNERERPDVGVGLRRLSRRGWPYPATAARCQDLRSCADLDDDPAFRRPAAEMGVPPTSGDAMLEAGQNVGVTDTAWGPPLDPAVFDAASVPTGTLAITDLLRREGAAAPALSAAPCSGLAPLASE